MENIIFFYDWLIFWLMHKYLSRPRSERSKLVSAITRSTEEDLESSKIRFLRNNEIGFGGSRSMANMIRPRGFEDAPTVGSGS